MRKCYLSAKKTLILSAVVLLGYTATAQHIDDMPKLKSKQSFALLGTVKEVEELEYQIEVSISTDSIVKNDTTYNLMSSEVLAFDSSGKLKRHSTSNYNSKGKIKSSYKHLYSYNKNGSVSTVRYYKDNTRQRTQTLAYDTKNRLIKLKELDKKRKPKSSTTYYYKEGKVYNIKIENEDNVMQNFIRLHYNRHNKIKLREYRGEMMQLLNLYKYIYDTLDGGSTRLNIYDYARGNKLREMNSYIYDSNGNTIQYTLTDSSKRVTHYQNNAYNNLNEIEHEVIFLEDDVRVETNYKYIYDNNKNWIEKHFYQDRRLTTITKRTITYYNQEAE